MDLKHVFDDNTEKYDRYRPTYPIALYQEIERYAEINQNTRILEIGFGTGQATNYFIDKGNDVTGIDIGLKLFAYTKQKYMNKPNLTLISGNFENYPFASDYYDLIYSATAFHWINPIIGYPKVLDLLKPNGVFAIFNNHPFVSRNNDLVHMAIQAVYQRYLTTQKKVSEFKHTDLEKISIQLTQYGFKDLQTNIYQNTRIMRAKDYVSLLDTYSDHDLIDNKIEFKKAIIKAINDNGGMINIYDSIDLYLARK